MIFLMQFGINKHLLDFSKTTNCNFVSLKKNLLMLIYSKLLLKSCDFLHKQHNFAANKWKYVFSAIKQKQHNSETKKGKRYFLWGEA